MVARLRGAGMNTHTMTEAKTDICSIIREAEKHEVLITRHGKPAAIVIGFRDEDEWFDYRLEHDEKFLRRIAAAREDIRNGRFVKLEALPD
jgi:prevent-host-death family protein